MLLYVVLRCVAWNEIKSFVVLLLTCFFTICFSFRNEYNIHRGLGNKNNEKKQEALHFVIYFLELCTIYATFENGIKLAETRVA